MKQKLREKLIKKAINKRWQYETERDKELQLRYDKLNGIDRNPKPLPKKTKIKKRKASRSYIHEIKEMERHFNSI